MSPESGTKRRVVVTGLGVITPLGNTLAALWQALSQGQSGVGPFTSLDSRHLPMSFAGEARAFTGSIDNFGPLEGEQKKAIRKGLKTVCREAQMGIAAAQLALFDAGLKLGGFDPDRTGVVFGSDYMVSEPEEFVGPARPCVGEDHRFQFSRWALAGLPLLNPLWLLKYLPNMPASHIAIYNDLRGPSNSLTQREAAGHLAVGEACRIILRGGADRMLAGATGTWVHPLKAVHAILQQQVAANGSEPQRACRPFDLDRTGMVLGEGSGVVVLEEVQTALARGATIYAEVAGCASCQVADRNLVGHREAALASVLRGALRDAGASPADVGHIQAQGMSTTSGDIAEARAIRAVFGPRADTLPVTAAKSYFGNLGAGSGLVELAAGVLALREGLLFPTLNYETPDPQCPISVVTAPDVDPGSSFLTHSVTPQGQAAGVMVRRFT